MELIPHWERTHILRALFYEHFMLWDGSSRPTNTTHMNYCMLFCRHWKKKQSDQRRYVLRRKILNNETDFSKHRFFSSSLDRLFVWCIGRRNNRAWSIATTTTAVECSVVRLCKSRIRRSHWIDAECSLRGAHTRLSAIRLQWSRWAAR